MKKGVQTRRGKPGKHSKKDDYEDMGEHNSACSFLPSAGA